MAGPRTRFSQRFGAIPHHLPFHSSSRSCPRVMMFPGRKFGKISANLSWKRFPPPIPINQGTSLEGDGLGLGAQGGRWYKSCDSALGRERSSPEELGAIQG